jgi:hypothetical protein
MRKKTWTSLRRGNSGSRNKVMTDKIEDLTEARRKRADAKGEFIEDFAFAALCIADVARNLAAYAHVVSENPGLLTLSKRKLAELMERDVKLLTEYIRELQHKAAEEEPSVAPASEQV